MQKKEFLTKKDWILRDQSNKLESIEAYFSGHGYDPHRHDTYAIGHTTVGVQSFNYCGELRHSLPGGTMVLHPDEKHDGHAGTSMGFQYQMVYLKPTLVQEVLNGKSLPFIKNGISKDMRLFQAIKVLFQRLQSNPEPLEEDDAIYDLIIALNLASGATQKIQPVDYLATKRAEEWIRSCIQKPATIDDLARHAGRNRWSLSRDFRALFGTSPYRYMMMRRLDLVKSEISKGASLTEATMTAGFFDQSHMTRHFTKTYGLSPAKWQKSLGRA